MHSPGRLMTRLPGSGRPRTDMNHSRSHSFRRGTRGHKGVHVSVQMSTGDHTDHVWASVESCIDC